MRNVIIVFGGHSPIGIEISNRLSTHSEVFHVTRSLDGLLVDQLSNRVEKIEFDIGHFGSHYAVSNLDEQMEKVLEKANTIVFGHRFRGKAEEIHAAISTEVNGPYKLIREWLNYQEKTNPKNVLFFTSPASTRIVKDQGVEYHVAKGALNQLIRFLSVEYAAENLMSIGIAPGSFVSKARSEHFYSQYPELLERILSKIPTKSFVQIAEIVDLVENLILKRNLSLSGNIINIDNGMSLLDFSVLSR